MAVGTYTTPTFAFTFTEEGLDLTQAYNVYVTYKGKFGKIVKTGEDLTISEKEIDVYLTQSDTGRMTEGEVTVQADWTTAAGGRAQSEKVRFKVVDSLLAEVVE